MTPYFFLGLVAAFQTTAADIMAALGSYDTSQQMFLSAIAVGIVALFFQREGKP